LGFFPTWEEGESKMIKGPIETFAFFSFMGTYGTISVWLWVTSVIPMFKDHPFDAWALTLGIAILVIPAAITIVFMIIKGIMRIIYVAVWAHHGIDIRACEERGREREFKNLLQLFTYRR
jgi:hypothetical protein